MVQPGFVDTRSAECLTVQSFHRKVRCRFPNDTRSRNNVQIDVGDFVGLDAADQLQLVQQALVYLCIAGSLGTSSFGYRQVWLSAIVDFFSLNVVIQRAERQARTVCRGDGVGPL